MFKIAFSHVGGNYQLTRLQTVRYFLNKQVIQSTCMEFLNKDVQNETLMWLCSLWLCTSFCTVKVKHLTVEQEEKMFFVCFFQVEKSWFKEKTILKKDRLDASSNSLSLSAETWISSAVAIPHPSMQTKNMPVMVSTDVVPNTWSFKVVYAMPLHTLNFHTVPFCITDCVYVLPIIGLWSV